MPVLPFEVIPIILSYLPQKDLYECMKVCRLWYSAASAIFYKQLTWRNSRDRELLELVEKPLIDGKKVGDYARKLDFYSDSTFTCLRRDGFETVINNLPKLEVIYATDTYIDYLNYIPDYKLTRLQEISMEITGSDLPDPIRTHYLANRRLKNQITTLKFVFGAVGGDDDDFEVIIPHLSSFTSLKKLIIINLGDWDNNPEHLMTSVLNTCRNLTYLVVYSDSRWIMNEAVSVRHSKLTSLQLYIPQLIPEHIECIMRCAPNLKEFRFRVDDYFYQEMSSREDASKLLSYLERIDCLDISTRNRTSASMISIPFFWDFWIALCGNRCSCYLDATAAHGYGSYETKFVKENNHLKALCLNGLDFTSDDYWADQMNFLTFNSIRLHNKRTDNKYINYDGYLDFVQPVLSLLQKQQSKCAIDIAYNTQVVYFDSVPIESKELFDKTRKRSDISHGYICEYMLESEMVNDLSTLYPSIQHLTLKNCLWIQEDNNYITHHMDLTPFNKIRQLECDFDSVFAKRKMIVPRLCIQFIGASGVFDYFYYDESNLFEFHYLGKQIPREIAIPLDVPIVEIHHAQVMQFVFTRNGKIVPIYHYMNCKAFE